MCFLGVFVLWAVLVVSYMGQILEQVALTGSRIGSRFVSEHARNLLSVVTMPAAITLVLVVLLAGLWRGSRLRALWAAAAVVAINASAQLLKHMVLWRPDFGLSQRVDDANTLPSGHTAVAASAAVALVLVVGPRWRSATACAGAVLAAAMGYSTLVCQWHRPADVMAALMLSIGWGAMAIACGAWTDGDAGPRHRATSSRRRSRPGEGPDPLVLALGGIGLVSGVVAFALEFATWRAVHTLLGRMDYFLAYAAGAAGTVAVSFTGFALLAGLSWHRNRGRSGGHATGRKAERGKRDEDADRA